MHCADRVWLAGDATGRPLAPAITWQCRRSTELCEAVRAAGHASTIEARTGLGLDPLFPAAKIAWLLRNVAAVREAASASTLRLGTVDAWLLWNFTQGTVHATDHSNASRTQLLDTAALRWDDELLAIFGVPASVLPALRAPASPSTLVSRAWRSSASSASPAAGVSSRPRMTSPSNNAWVCSWIASGVKRDFIARNTSRIVSGEATASRMSTAPTMSSASLAPAWMRLCSTRLAKTTSKSASSRSISAWLGGVALESGVSYANLPFIGALGSLLCLGLVLATYLQERRARCCANDNAPQAQPAPPAKVAAE